MSLRVFLAFVLVTASLNGQAQKTCSGFHTPASKATTLQFARDLDLLNQTYNEFVFGKKIEPMLERDLSGLPLGQWARARYEVFKLNRLLGKLEDAGDWDRYDFGKFARKLEKLVFLADPDVPLKMSSKDRALYRQIQHSILVDGLENFLFEKRPVPPGWKQRFFNALKLPFKTAYNRWFTAWLVMPKLHGAVIPWEVAMEVAWKGWDNSQDILAPYRPQSSFKASFNSFSTVYNSLVVVAVFGVLPLYGYSVYKDLQARGEAKAAELFAPMLEAARQIGAMDYRQSAIDLEIQSFRSAFREKYQRDPSEEDMERIREYVQGRR